MGQSLDAIFAKPGFANTRSNCVRQTPISSSRMNAKSNMNSTDGPVLLRPAALTVFFVLFVLAAVTGGSFWLDEAGTAYAASRPTLGQWWHFISTSGMTEVQMPLYSAYIWVFAKLFGIGEYALRLGGALWLAPGLVAFAVSFPQWQRRLAGVLVVATNAFIWYYANEARTYAMQLGGSCMVLAALNRLASVAGPTEKEGKWLFLLAFGLLTVCGTSMLGMVWAAAALGAAWVLFPAERLLAWWRRSRLLWLLLAAILAALGCYYVWTVRQGARGSNVATTDWRTTLFIVYEQFGFGGLGPGRTELRAGGLRALLPYVPGLACYAVALAGILYFGLKEFCRQSRRKTALLSIVIALPWIFLSLAGMATHFRLLGRHSAPLAAVWFFWMAGGVAVLARKPGWMAKAAVTAFLGLSLCSSLIVRFDYGHSKDDYRRASELAAAALSERQAVWWNANKFGAWYYHLPLSESQPGPGKALLVNNLPDETLAGWPAPQLIVASKPDLYDNSGALGRYISGHGFRLVAAFPAFNIWAAKEAKE